MKKTTTGLTGRLLAGAFPKAATLWSLAMMVVFPGFGQGSTNQVKADRYTTAVFDVAIFPANYDGFIPGQHFTPAREEIDKAEAALIKDLRKLNKGLENQSSTPVIHENLHNYKRQYFGYVDNNGKRILLINCFWAPAGEDPDGWLTGMIMVLDGGSYYWNVKFSLDDGKLFGLTVNGYA